MENNFENLGIDYKHVVYDDHQHVFITRQIGSDRNIGAKLSDQFDHQNSLGSFRVIITFTYKQTVDIQENWYNQETSTPPIISYILNNALTQHLRVPENQMRETEWFGMGNRLIQLHMNRSHQNIEVDKWNSLFRGLSVKVKIGNGGQPFVNIGLIHEVLVNMDIDVIQFYAHVVIGEQLRHEDVELLSSRRFSMNELQMREFEAVMNGIQMRTIYPPIRQYTFQSMARHKNSVLTAQSAEFEDHDGRRMTVQQYYEWKYGIKLKFPQLPLLKMNRTKDIFIPIELLNIPLRPQHIRRRLEPHAVALVCRYATNSPVEYFRREQKGSRAYAPQIEGFGIKIENDQDGEPNFMRVDGRVLPEPRCQYAVVQPHPLSKPIFEPGRSFYLIACEANVRSNPKHNEFVRMLMDIGYEMRLRYSNNNHAQCDTRDFYSRQDVERYMKEMQKRTGRHLSELLFLFFVDGSDDIAKICVRVGGVMNVMEKTQTNPCNEAFTRFTITGNTTIFIGIFSTKPQANDSRDTVLGISFNIDVQACKFASNYDFFESGNDFFNEVERLFYYAIRTFEVTTKMLPDNVVVFRGGITDNIADMVAEFECNKMEKGWSRVIERLQLPKKRLQLMYLNVERKHKMCFKKEEIPRHARVVEMNLDRGTVIDSIVTSTDGNDFYLCSHKGILGTSRPAYYKIHRDDWNVRPDDLQVIIYCLCYLVARSVNSVSIPAPLYYAGLVCHRVRYYLRATERSFFY
ncbi:hypothetical protein M3Y98_00117400 [Aphelenchoides besseyi]|nr:hypothetical protein M3Y98_00117400 [Aphelenchoides besseyi]